MTVGSFLVILGSILVSLWNSTQDLAARVQALEQSARDHDVQDAKVAEDLRRKMELLDTLDKESATDRRGLVSRIIALEVTHERVSDRLNKLELSVFGSPPTPPHYNFNQQQPRSRPNPQQRDFGG